MPMASRTTQNQKGNKTMNAMVGNMMAAAVVAAGMIAPRAAEAVGYDVLCPHVKLGKVLGVNREVLKDKSRFPHGESAFPREEVKLDTPVFGFREATFNCSRCFSEVGETAELTVEFENTFDSNTDESALEKELQKTCDAVADVLGIEPVKVALEDVNVWKRIEWNCLKTRVVFHLAEGQSINVEAVESMFVMRKGKPVRLTASKINVKITLNPGFRHFADAGMVEGKVEDTIDIGPDCSAALAKAMAKHETWDMNVLRAKKKVAKKKAAKKDALKPEPKATPKDAAAK